MKKLSKADKNKLKRVLIDSRKRNFEGVWNEVSLQIKSGRKLPPFYILGGEALWEMGRLEEAANFCKNGLKLFPEIETLSILYFQILVELGLRADAKMEMLRFMKIRSSEEYKKIAKDYGW